MDRPGFRFAHPGYVRCPSSMPGRSGASRRETIAAQAFSLPGLPSRGGQYPWGSNVARSSR